MGENENDNIINILKSLPILLFGALLIFISTIIDHSNIFHHLFRDVGIGAVVAYFIIITVEYKQRRHLSSSIEKFLSSTNQKIFQTILGTEFPEGMYRFVRDKIMREAFFRTETIVNYHLSKNDSPSSETINIEVSSSHVICNLSDKHQEYSAPFFVEKMPSGGIDYNKDIQLFIDGEEVSEEEIKEADAKWEDTEDFIRFKYTIKMKPNQKTQVKFVHKMNHKLISDTEVWRSIYPCDGVQFTINFPHDFNVGVDALHVDGYERQNSTDTMILGRIKRPLFPHNGFLFWWQPKGPTNEPIALLQPQSKKSKPDVNT